MRRSQFLLGCCQQPALKLRCAATAAWAAQAVDANRFCRPTLKVRARPGSFAQHCLLLKPALVLRGNLRDRATGRRVTRVASTTVRPPGKRGVTTSSRNACQSASLTWPPSGRLRPKYRTSRTKAVSPESQLATGTGSPGAWLAHAAREARTLAIRAPFHTRTDGLTRISRPGLSDRRAPMSVGPAAPARLATACTAHNRG